MIKVPWTSFKALIDSKQEYPQFVENDEYVFLAYVEGGFHVECHLHKIIDSTSVAEFDSGYRASSNRPVTAKPAAFPEASGFRARFQGQYFEAPHSTTTDLDLQIASEKHINGVTIWAKNTGEGDSAKFQVVDKDGLYYPAGTVLEEFVTDWQIPPHEAGTPAVINTVTTPFRAKIVAGLYVRIKYTATGTPASSRKLGINLHTYIKTP